MELGLAGWQCTLRAAIESANTTAGLQFIDFAIPGSATITPTSALPIITEQVVIDGTTQIGYAGTPVVELDGSAAGANTDGLDITGGGITVRALAINRFGGSGIVLRDFGWNTIEQNVIGLDRSGTIDRGNGAHGVLIDSPHNTIGGSDAAKRNVIGFNARNGVTVVSTQSPAVENRILSNSIFSNRGLGIDLGDDGTQINDAGDVDEGPNLLQNSPVLLEAIDGFHTYVRGSINGKSISELLLQFFASSGGDPSGVQQLLGSGKVTPDAQGFAPFSFALSSVAEAGAYATATATDWAGNTSEFAAPILIVLEPNEPPTAAAGGPYEVLEGQTATLDASATRDLEQPTDTMAYEWDLDGDGIFGESGTNAQRGAELGIHPVFSATGLKSPLDLPVSLRVTDYRGLVDEDTTIVRVTRTLVVVGTTASDVIQIGPSASGADLLVNLNGSVSQYVLAYVAGFTIDAGAGNDRIEIAAALL